jgi:ArsR family transcriptional regulator
MPANGKHDSQRDMRKLRLRPFTVPGGLDLPGNFVYAIAYMARVVKQSVVGGSADRMFRAFSDRTRLRILHLLLDGELCVCDLVRVLQISQPKISRHLAYLRKSGLVQARKDGLWMHYQLVPADSDFHQSLIDCLRHCFNAVPELKRDRKRLGPEACGPECCS